MWNTDPVIVVLCLLALCAFLVCFCVVQAVTIRDLRGELKWAGVSYAAQGRSLREALMKLAAAQKNDRRDAKGRYASLEDENINTWGQHHKASVEAICIPPGDYPAKR